MGCLGYVVDFGFDLSWIDRWVWVFDWLVCDFDVCELGCLELIVWICVSVAVVCRILVSLEFG